MRASSLRILYAVAAREKLKMRRWDFVAAYLQGSLEDGEFAYCQPPKGYSTREVNGKVQMVPEGEGDGVRRVCRVEKPVYGMAQAGRRWQRALFPWLLDWSDRKLQQSTADTCIFHYQGTNSTPNGPRTERLIDSGVLRGRPVCAV